MAFPEYPLVKELLEALARFKLEHLAQVVRLGGAVGKPLQISLERPPEVLVADVVPEHVEHAPALFVRVPVKEVVWVLVHLGHDGPDISVAGFLEIVVGSQHHVVLELVVAPACLPVEGIAVGGEPLVEPDVLPVPARDKVAKPLVGKLMRH